SLSMKITDSPAAMLAMPFNAMADPKDLESSSIFHPVISTAALPRFVTSNQSAASGLFPLDHGATSEMMSAPVPLVVAVTDKWKSALASGRAPTAGSSTLTVTL